MKEFKNDIEDKVPAKHCFILTSVSGQIFIIAKLYGIFQKTSSVKFRRRCSLVGQNYSGGKTPIELGWGE